MKEWNAAQLELSVFSQLFQHWAVLTAGQIGHYNAMTINWGSFGTLWQRPVVTVYVKPARYTHEFMTEQDYFTVSFFGERYHGELVTLGSTSGRTDDKLARTSLTPERRGQAVIYREAGVTLVCRKLYTLPMARQGIPQDVTDRYYRTDAPHTMFFGEVVEILQGDDAAASGLQGIGISVSPCEE